MKSISTALLFLSNQMETRKFNSTHFFLLIATLSCLSMANAVWMRLPNSGSKCVSEEIQANVVVLAEYYAYYEEDESGTAAYVSCKVTSPYGNHLHNQENVTKGQFAFTALESGTYLACFTLRSIKPDSAASVNINWKVGVAARDWDSVAKREKIEGVELELRKLESSVEAIHDNLLYLKTREAEMRDVSEMTNSKIASYSFMAIGICILVSVLQLWHLQKYFEKKKLI